MKMLLIGLICFCFCTSAVVLAKEEIKDKDVPEFSQSEEEIFELIEKFSQEVLPKLQEEVLPKMQKELELLREFNEILRERHKKNLERFIKGHDELQKVLIDDKYDRAIKRYWEGE